ncbi:MAG: hypothetical protein NT068_02330 [Candidatus Nomurabacteria bacterium]|nr:hypothetical protein [Candidatus Nomurabacteria bacterium]
MNPQIKKIILFVGIALVVILVAIFFFKKSPTTTVSLTSSAKNSAPVTTSGTVAKASPVVGQQFLTTLLNINNIKLDDSIFSDPSFATLTNSSIELVSEGNEGRLCPFLPIGTECSPILSNTNPLTGAVLPPTPDSSIIPPGNTVQNPPVNPPAPLTGGTN